MEQFPPIPKDLLDALEAAYPERSPELSDNIDAIRHQAGQRSVVRFLRHKFEEQNQSLLTDRITPHGHF